MATDFPAIRDMQASLIEALTPSKLSSVPFRRDEGRVDFREWATKNATAALRRFSIERIDEDPVPEVTNADAELVETSAVITLAYPKAYTNYGAENIRDLSDVVELDYYAIRDAIGPLGQHNYTVDAWPLSLSEETTVQDGGAVWFVSTAVNVAFWEDR